jgi:hypothetical protein
MAGTESIRHHHAAIRLTIHRGDIDAVIDHMLKDGESAGRRQAFVFDRQAVGKLVLSLWTFVRGHRGLITRSDGAGDIRVTVDFSHVIPPAQPSPPRCWPLTQRAQKITGGDCAGIAGDGLHQQAWRAVLGIALSQ